MNITKKTLHTNIGGSLLRIVFASVVASLSGITARADSLWTHVAQDFNWFNPANWEGDVPSGTNSGTIIITNGGWATIVGESASWSGPMRISGGSRVVPSVQQGVATSIGAQSIFIGCEDNPELNTNNHFGVSSGWGGDLPENHIWVFPSVTATDVYVGQGAGATGNLFSVAEVTLNNLYVGAAGNVGNIAGFINSSISIGTLHVASGNMLSFAPSLADNFDDLWSLISGGQIGELYVDDTLVTADNITTLFTLDDSNGTLAIFTAVAAAAVPEASTWAAFAGLALLAWAALHRGRHGRRS
ncbi:MAG: hypothetical protein LBK99_24810 [Opitutaceae bacterium]|nr:hypothetical protein [Opitutaceae bacterium]